jgi:RND family efflux transporter MFP subunit
MTSQNPQNDRGGDTATLPPPEPKNIAGQNKPDPSNAGAPQGRGEDRGNGNAPKDAGKDHPDAGDHGGGHGADHEEVIPKDLPQPSSFTVAVVAVVFALMLVGLFLIGWFPHAHRLARANADAADAADKPPIVALTTAKTAPAEKDVVLPADVRAFQSTDIFPQATGYMSKLNCDINDRVKAGDILAVIATPALDAQILQAKAALEQARAAVPKAQADVALAHQTLQRDLDAEKSAPGSVPRQTVDQSQDAYDDAVAALAQAKANVDASQATVQQLAATQSFDNVVAPFSGIITARNYDVGAYLSPSNVGAGKQLFSIQNTDPLRVFISVPQTYSDDVRINQPAYLAVINFPGKEFRGAVARTSGSLDPTTRTLWVEVDVPNPDNTLYAGMYGQVRLPISTQHPTLTIPTSALVFNATGLQVAIVKDNKVHFQPIKVGRDLGTEIEVTSGLTSDDQIVSTPGEQLVENGDVTVQDSDKPDAGKSRVATAQ